jgi:hypothetical protein
MTEVSVTVAGAREACGPLSGARGRGRAAVKAAGGATGAWLCGALVAMLGRDAPVLGGALRGAPLAPGAVAMATMAEGRGAPEGAPKNAPLAPMTGAGARKGLSVPWRGERGRGHAAAGGAGRATGARRCGTMVTMSE